MGESNWTKVLQTAVVVLFSAAIVYMGAVELKKRTSRAVKKAGSESVAFLKNRAGTDMRARLSESAIKNAGKNGNGAVYESLKKAISKTTSSKKPNPDGNGDNLSSDDKESLEKLVDSVQ